MKIEVACKTDATTKDKGDLLEGLAKKLLAAQSFDVIEEIRFTGVEIDLLCMHRGSGREIYVECKARKEKVSANALNQLVGTVVTRGYAEGWILTTSELGKEAKGFVEEWKNKPSKPVQLAFYTPDLIVDSLQSSSVIRQPPLTEAAEFAGGEEFLGEWVLVITIYGYFWIVYVLVGGEPNAVLVYNATNGRHIADKATLDNLGQLEAAFSDYDLSFGESHQDGTPTPDVSPVSVVEVQTGDSWDDYRPARPKDFVGRADMQKQILGFLNNAQEKSIDTRIFAITGNSGLGKSSLIAKVRDRCRNRYYRKRFFIFAVDVRGARSPTYISASLIKCLRAAQAQGFGAPEHLQVNDPASPLSSPTIAKYLQSLESSGQVVCLIFDQFEELYSQPELFGVFAAAKDLMLDVSATKGNFTLGFAWKTDSTTQQDHPAYHMWHELSDYRRVYKLDVFSDGEIANAMTLFEKEIKSQISVEVRHQIAHASQGFPWLLKKLCINLSENIRRGRGTETNLADLDVRRLFQDDLDQLTPTELTCLKIVAQKAPADWSEIIEISGVATLNNLVNKRLIVKSGDRLNVYWDIFKDYLVSGRAPVIPFNYIPTSDISSMLKVFSCLKKSTYVAAEEIATQASLKETTVLNIGADLVMFGLAERKGGAFKARQELPSTKEAVVLQKLRDTFGKHALKLALYKSSAGKTVDPSKLTTTLKACLPKKTYGDKTWRIYTNRLANFLVHTGYLVNVARRLTVQDIGAPVSDRQKIGSRRGRRSVIFPASASPFKVCQALESIEADNNVERLLENGFRNALAVLKRFDLVNENGKQLTLNTQAISKYGGYHEAIWTSAKNEESIVKCINSIQQKPSMSALDLGAYVAEEYGMGWTTASRQRNGNALRQWAMWVKKGIDSSTIPPPPGRAGQ